MDLLDLFAKITLDTSGYEQGLNSAVSTAHKVGDGIKSALGTVAKVSAAAIGAAATGVAALTKSAVENFAEYEQLVGGVETLFKSSADTVQEYAANAYKTAGLSANEYMETVTSFSASLLQSLGGNTEAAAQVADKAITDMADNANKMGTSMESIQNAYQGFAKQNYTMLDNLKLGFGGTKEEMQRLLETANEYNRQQGINTDYQIESYADIVEAIHVVQTEMGITGTTAAEAATTIQGSLSSVGAAWQNLVTGIADENADFGTLIDNFAESAVTALDNLLPRVKTALEGVGKLVTELSPVIAEAIPGLVDDVLPSVLQAAVDLVTALVNALVDNGATVANTALDIVDMLVNALIDNAYNIVDGAFAIITTLVNGIGERLPELVPAAIGIISQIVGGIIDNTGGLIFAAVQIVAQLAGGIAENASIIADGAVYLVTSLANGITELLPELASIAAGIVSQIVDAITGELPQIVSAGLLLFTSLIDALPDAIVQIVDVLPGIVTSIVGALMDTVPQIIDAGITLFTALVGDLPGIIATVVEAVPQIITGVVDAVTNSIPQIIDAGMELFTALIANLPQIIVTIVGAVPQIITSVTSAVVGSVPKLIEAGITLFSALIGDLPAIIAGVVTAVPQIVTGITDAFSGFVPQMNDVGKDLIKGVGEGLINSLSEIESGVKKAGNTIVGWFKDIFDGVSDESVGFMESTAQAFEEQSQKTANAANAANEAIIGISLTGQSYAEKYQNTAKEIKDSSEEVTKVITTGGTKAAQATKQSGEKQKSVLVQNMEAIERLYKQRKLTEEQYQAQRLEYLEKNRNEESDEWTKYYDSVQTYYDKLAKTEQEAAKKAVEETKKNFKTILDNYDKQLAEIQKKIESFSQKLTGAYKDFYSFDTDEEGKITGAFITDKMTQAGKQLEEYYNQITKFSERGIGTDMISQLADVSEEEGLAMVEYWNSLSDEQLKNLQAHYDKVVNMSTKVSELIYGDKTKAAVDGVVSEIELLVESDERFKTVGEMMLDGIMQGLNSGDFDITQLAGRISTDFNNAFNDFGSGAGTTSPGYAVASTSKSPTTATTFPTAEAAAYTPKTQVTETAVQGGGDVIIENVEVKIDKFNNYGDEDIEALTGKVMIVIQNEIFKRKGARA